MEPENKQTEGEPEKPRVLVVDDDRSLRRLVQMMLQREFEVEEASRADEALELLERRAYDAVVMDIHLGAGPSGTEVMRGFRERHPEAPTPFIACTAYADLGSRKDFLAHGFSDYIFKPFTQLGLIVTIKRVLTGG